jgi:hypothetical protein
MTKDEIYDACQGKISKTSIKQYSGDWVISGKYGMIENLGNLNSPHWVVWITGVHLDKILPTITINTVLSKIKSMVKSVDTTYNGEATCVCTDENQLGDLAILLGARRKRQISAEQKEQQRLTLAKARAKKRPH